MINHTTLKISATLKNSMLHILLLIVFCLFFNTLNSTVITLEKDLVIKFVNTVRYMLYQDSLKTSMLSVKNLKIAVLLYSMSLLYKKTLIDSILLFNKDLQINNLQKLLNIPWYRSKLFYFIYGILTAGILAGILNK